MHHLNTDLCIARGAERPSQSFRNVGVCVGDHLDGSEIINRPHASDDLTVPRMWRAGQASPPQELQVPLWQFRTQTKWSCPPGVPGANLVNGPNIPSCISRPPAVGSVRFWRPARSASNASLTDHARFLWWPYGLLRTFDTCWVSSTGGQLPAQRACLARGPVAIH